MKSRFYPARKGLFRVFHLALAAWFAALAVVPAYAAAEYSFAVVPQFERRKVFAIWQPIVDELQKRSGVKLKLTTTLTVVEYGQQMRKGAYDFVYVNPYYVLKFYPIQGYLPLVRDAKNLRGIVVVRQDSPIQRPEDLQGKTVAVPTLNAFGASLMVQADLANLYQVKVTVKDAKTHTSAYFQTINGLVDAAGGVQKTLQEQEPAVRDALRVVYTTGELPSHPLAAHPRVPKKVQDKIRAAFLAMSEDPAMKPLLDKVPMQKAVATSMDDYLPAAKLGLDRYWVEE